MEKINENELFEEIVLYLSAALSLAGVKDSKMESALEIYESALDSFDENAEYNYKIVCEIIAQMRANHADLFQ